MNKKIKDLFDKLEEIPPSEVINRCNIPLQKVESRGSGHFRCLCPFPGHQDEKLGSFDVNDTKKIAKCFACGKGGRPIRFFRDLNGLRDDYIAGIEMAVVFGLITKEERDSFVEDKDVEFSVKEYFTKKKVAQEIKMAPVADMDAFYRAFTEVQPLSDEDREYLLGRGVRENDLKDFFSDRRDTEQLLREIQSKLNWKMSRYIGIPGIFCKKKDGKKYIRLSARKSKGIGIKIYNQEGQVIAVQYRNHVATKSGRYFWYSSSFANKEEYPAYSDGASPGTPVGFESARGPKKYPSVVITEGKFKALELANRGLDCFTVQGVETWKRIIPELEKYFTRKEKRRIWLAFDADLKTNSAVARATYLFHKELVKSGYDVGFLDWDIELGKGIDDALIAGAKIRKIPGSVFIDQVIKPNLPKLN